MAWIKDPWRKSSFSIQADCVEVQWRKPSLCNTGGCVEVGDNDGEILVRNSKRPDAGVLEFTRAEMAAFVQGCKAGEFDDLAGLG